MSNICHRQTNHKLAKFAADKTNYTESRIFAEQQNHHIIGKGEIASMCKHRQN